MSEPFLGQIQMVGFNFAPRGWAECNGQLLPIAQNTAVFSLLGTTYGGDGVQTFALPDLQGRAPIHAGQGAGLSPYDLGEEGGASAVTLPAGAMPAHSHVMNGDAGAATTGTPAGMMLALANTTTYAPANADTGQMSSATIGPSGSGQAHNNLQPYLCVMFIIALQGIFPSRN